MALILGESKIPALLVAYLVTRRSDSDNPMPAANLLALVAGPVKPSTVRSFPSVEVWVSSFSLGDRRDDERYEVMLDLHADPATVLATELGWLAALRRALAGGPSSANSNATDADTNPFMAYLNGLDDTASANWKVDDAYVSGGDTMMLEGQRVMYRTAMRFKVRTNVLTV